MTTACPGRGDPRPRIVFNALPLDARGGGVSTYIRELLGALIAVIDVRPGGGGPAVGSSPSSPTGVTPLVVGRVATGCAGRWPAPWGSGRPTWSTDSMSTCRSGGPGRGSPPCTTWPCSTSRGRSRATGRPVSGSSSRHALRRADAIVAVSAFTAERVPDARRPRRRGRPRAPGPDMAPAAAAEVARVRARYGLPDRFVLHVGNIEPRKDLAHPGRGVPRGPDPAGRDRATGCGATRPPARSPRSATCPTGDLPGLYGAATLVGYASRYEGFGLPPVEAMACGAPVVSTPVPAVTELVGDGVEVFEPGDVEGLTATLRQLVRRAPTGRAGRPGCPSGRSP